MLRAYVTTTIEVKQTYMHFNQYLLLCLVNNLVSFIRPFTQTNTLIKTHDSNDTTVTRCIDQVCAQPCPAVCCGNTGHDANLQQGEPLQAPCSLGAARCVAPVPGARA